METPKSTKQLKSFLERFSYVHRFISALTELREPFYKLLKKDGTFQWSKEQQTAFQKVKDILGSSPTMVPPVKGLPLTLI